MTSNLRILQFGVSGQLGRALLEAAAAQQVRLSALSRTEADLAQPGTAAGAVAAQAADLVVIAAAYTAVDRAESEEALAHRVNAEAAAEIAAACAARDVPVIYISTDYVFSGEGERAWREDDPVAPLNAYGRTKAAGEHAVLAASPRNLTLRTSWVFSPWGRNFVTAMLRLARERHEVTVVDDQRGRPTSALDLAAAIIRLAPLSVAGRASGILHFANRGEVSWADFAESIFFEAAARGWSAARVQRIPSSAYPTPARRPHNSVLDTSRFERLTGSTPSPWSEALQRTLDRLEPADGSSQAA